MHPCCSHILPTFGPSMVCPAKNKSTPFASVQWRRGIDIHPLTHRTRPLIDPPYSTFSSGCSKEKTHMEQEQCKTCSTWGGAEAGLPGSQQATSSPSKTALVICVGDSSQGVCLKTLLEMSSLLIPTSSAFPSPATHTPASIHSTLPKNLRVVGGFRVPRPSESAAFPNVYFSIDPP